MLGVGGKRHCWHVGKTLREADCGFSMNMSEVRCTK